MPSPATASTSRIANSTIRHHPISVGGEALGSGTWLGLVSRESLEGGIWILSVLFCSCVCFGNIGRRLALKGVGRRANMSGGIPKGNGSGESTNGAEDFRREGTLVWDSVRGV